MLFAIGKIALAVFIVVVSSSAYAVGPTNCAPVPITPVDRSYDGGKTIDYNRDLVAMKFGEFATASSDVYNPAPLSHGSLQEGRSFHLADNDPVIQNDASRFGSTGWRRLIIKAGRNFAGHRFDGPGGLVFDSYYRIDGANLIVLVAYRGTENSILDWISNASWLTQWVNPYDQYREARNLFPVVVAAANALPEAQNRRIAYITTGHSLGGGLALHVAHRFDCVSAVVFNASFVTNEVLFGRYNPVSIRIYENLDFFSSAARRFKSGTNTSKQADYRMGVRPPSAATNGIEYQHNMESLAAGMLRYTLSCVMQSSYQCEFAKSAASRSRALYCLRYINLRSAKNPNLRDDEACHS
jgi:pimeloyl-ACP methyl ester carboxylesterase